MEISYDQQDAVALIKMDDGKKNAITDQALDQLEACFDKAEADAAAVVLAGRPGSFCAGFDINVLKSGDMKAFAALGRRGGRFATRLYGFRKPLVAACTGHAFTIGAIWLTASDTRIGDRGDFKFGMTETALGQVLPPWALEPLKARLNPVHFVSAVAQSKIYDPEGAVSAGFLDRLVDNGTAIDAALEEAAMLAQLSADAYGGNKLSTRRASIEIMKADLA